MAQRLNPALKAVSDAVLAVAANLSVDEVLQKLVHAARDLATRLLLSRISSVEGDAASLARSMTIGSVFFLYCPFSGDRLANVLTGLEPIARTRMIRVCCVDLPLPPCSWLALEPQLSRDLAIYRSTLHDKAFGRRTSAPQRWRPGVSAVVEKEDAGSRAKCSVKVT